MLVLLGSKIVTAKWYWTILNATSPNSHFLVTRFIFQVKLIIIAIFYTTAYCSFFLNGLSDSRKINEHHNTASVIPVQLLATDSHQVVCENQRDLSTSTNCRSFSRNLKGCRHRFAFTNANTLSHTYTHTCICKFISHLIVTIMHWGMKQQRTLELNGICIIPTYLYTVALSFRKQQADYTYQQGQRVNTCSHVHASTANDWNFHFFRQKHFHDGATPPLCMCGLKPDGNDAWNLRKSVVFSLLSTSWVVAHSLGYLNIASILSVNIRIFIRPLVCVSEWCEIMTVVYNIYIITVKT